MSWIIPTLAMLVVGFACIWGLCEWFVARRHRGGPDDDPSTTG